MALPPDLASLDFQADFSDTPPAVLLEWGHKIQSNLDGLPSQSSTTGQIIRAGLEWLDSVRASIAAAGIFSTNEDGEDLLTDNMKFLLVPFYVGELLAHGGGMEERLGMLRRAVGEYEAFLRRCYQYDMLGEMCRATWRRVEEDITADANTKRTEKVSRHRREKQVMSELGRLRALKGRKTRLEQDAEEYSFVDGIDEESERDLWKLQIEFAVLKAISQRELISQEAEILSMMQSRPQDCSTSTMESRAYNDQSHQQLKSIAVDLLKQSGKATARKQVFRPSHILPKYTVEQQAEWEMADAMNRDKQQKEAERQIENSEANEDPDDDEELGKQRVWDDWKDDHPYGYGNSRLRPCA